MTSVFFYLCHTVPGQLLLFIVFLYLTNTCFYQVQFITCTFLQVYKYLAYVEAQAANEDTDADNASPTKEYYQNLQEACSLLQAYLKMTNPADVWRL